MPKVVAQRLIVDRSTLQALLGIRISSITILSSRCYAYQFDMKLRLGPMQSDLVVSGEVDGDGAIQGTFEAQGNSLSPLQAFKGALAGAGN